MDVPGAAEVLGLSNDAVRKRASRGTVPARKTGSRWQVGVIIDRTPTGNRPDTNRTDDLITQPSENARLQLEVIRDEWLQPLINQITDQAKVIGRLEARIEELETSTIASSQSSQTPPSHDGDTVPISDDHSSPEQSTGRLGRLWRFVVGE